MLICAEHLTKRVTLGIQSLTILQDISINIDRGESLAIIGVSGSGKSTLLGLLAGLDDPTEGKVSFKGINLAKLDDNKRAAIRANQIGFIFQSFQLLPSLTALENVMLALEIKNSKNAESIAKAWLEKVGLSKRLTHYPQQLSGGEQQRVAIARAFSVEPQVLFADEPTGNLDQATAATIIDLLFAINRETKTTLICVTHDPSLGKKCSRTLQLAGGRIIQ